jgi:23S rRNA (adenine2503-C2)-methyltransferase
MSKTSLKDLLKALGEPAFRVTQIFEGLYKHRWATWEAFTNLPKSLRERLQDDVDLAWPDIVEAVTSEDGSTKHAFRLADGKLVEGVYMPYTKRTTLCLSSQVGCAMGCTFCATGQMGITRNLSAAEIVGQVMAMLNAHGHATGAPVNLVFMGRGEPLHNLNQVMRAFELLRDAAGLAIPPRRITLSTSGLVSGIETLAKSKVRPRLAVSLNATTDGYRSKIMPVNRVWNLEALAKVLQSFPLESGERVTLEYVLLKGMTDSLEDARRLAAFARKFPCKINLIPFNPHEAGAGAEAHGTAGSARRARATEGARDEGAGAEAHRRAKHDGPGNEGGFEPPTEERIHELCKYLAAKDLTVSVRRSRGQDVAGACGQLVREGQKKSETL